MHASLPSLIEKYESRVRDLEKEKLVMQEKINSDPELNKKLDRFDDLFKHSMETLSNPQKLWLHGQFEHKRAVLKLAFKDNIIYDRNNGVQTPEITLPFSMLQDFCNNKPKSGGLSRNRTTDTRIFSPLLYQLS